MLDHDAENPTDASHSEGPRYSIYYLPWTVLVFAFNKTNCHPRLLMTRCLSFMNLKKTYKLSDTVCLTFA